MSADDFLPGARDTRDIRGVGDQLFDRKEKEMMRASEISTRF